MEIRHTVEKNKEENDNHEKVGDRVQLGTDDICNHNNSQRQEKESARLEVAPSAETQQKDSESKIVDFSIDPS